MSADLGLDPSDPLNLLLHNTSQNADSSTSADSQELSSPEDWSKFSALWTEVADQASNPIKPYADIMDFADLNSMPMDMDFNPSMSIEPSSLHYDSMKYANSGIHLSYDDQYGLSSELLATQFPFTFQFNGSDMSSSSSSSSASPQSSTKERRLSVTSSSSSSGASLSPMPESISSPVPVYNEAVPEPIQYDDMPSSYANDPAAELAHRVRQSAGVMLAVPMNTQIQGQSSAMASAQSKIPPPKAPRHNAASIPKPASPTSSSSAASTPPPSTPPNSFKLSLNTAPIALAPSPEAFSTPTAPTPSGSFPRPKTSHTTIERRYRTNLNARIQSLRMAVPALRVLEDREGNGKKIKKNVKGSVLIKGTNTGIIDSEDGTVDIIDERGFVDGVKVARKCSKANVLGKAVEYIRVLKKREQRLKAEQAGLKTLVSGLVGGPALVREWEKEWRAKFGGEEKDEVEGDDDDGDDEDSDEEDGDEGDEDGGRKRKRAKASTTTVAAKKPADKKEKKPLPPVVMLGNEHDPNQIPEKRKRGRPRKVLPPPVTLSPNVPQEQATSTGIKDEVMHPQTPFSTTQPHWVQQQPQPQQFLLAVFALFSFYNSPLTSSSMGKAHQHTGTVLNPPLAYAPEIISYFSPPPEVSNAWAWKEYVQILHLVASLLVLASFLMNWFGISFGFGKAVARGRSMPTNSFRNSPRPSGPFSWLKMGEKYILEGRMASLSFYDRLQIYRSVPSRRNASPSQLATIAMVIQSAPGVIGNVARMKARSIWAAAKAKASTSTPSRIHESMVLALDLDTASALVGQASEKDKSDGEKSLSPIEVLGCLVVKDRLKEHLGKLFVDTVNAEDICIGSEDAEKEKKQEQEWRKTIDAASELGGHLAELGKMFERVWKSSSMVLELEDMEELSVGSESSASVDGEINALLVALVFYRQLFDFGCASPCSTSTLLLSPPPSPTSKTAAKRAKMLLALRTALGNRVFEDTEEQEKQVEEEDEKNGPVMGLEDAKDRVVDLIVELERRERRSSSP